VRYIFKISLKNNENCSTKNVRFAKIVCIAYTSNNDFAYFSIAVLSVFSEIHHSEKLKTRKRQRSSDENNTTEIEPMKLEIGTQIEVG